MTNKNNNKESVRLLLNNNIMMFVGVVQTLGESMEQVSVPNYRYGCLALCEIKVYRQTIREIKDKGVIDLNDEKQKLCPIWNLIKIIFGQLMVHGQHFSCDSLSYSHFH